MTLEDFKEICDEAAAGVSETPYGVYREFEGKLAVYQKTGAASGGNCWEGVARYYPSGSDDPDADDMMTEILEKVLGNVAPEVTFLQYRSIMKSLKEDERRDREFYGNYTDYRVLSIEYADLLRQLQEMGYAQEFEAAPSP